MTPRNFLFASFEGGGSVGPALTVVRKLLARGHRVRFMSDACNRSEAEAVGAVFVPWTRAPSRPDRSRDSDLLRDWEVDPMTGFERTLDNLMIGPASLYAQDLVEELDREAADLVVSNEMLFGPMLGCEAAGQRLALLSANICVYPLIPDMPPLGAGLAPACTDEERALQAAIAAGSAEMLAARLPALNEARAALGLPPLGHVLDQLGAAEALLLGTARSFDFAAEALPPFVRYVGPQLDDPAWARQWRSPWPAGDGRPLVLAAFSTTFQDHAGALQRVIDAAADLPVRLLVTLGDAIAPGELRPAANSFLLRSAPHNAVMREAALAVTHGGHGTVARALVHGLPMLVMPHGRDQADNAVRVTERGAGLSLPPGAAAAEIRVALGRLLDERPFAEAARSLGARVAGEAADSPVVGELESLAATVAGRGRHAA
ncbi:MAG TPA: nucleotide disphospho-sugar-binding domain-containing protein [Allosphingosinicella sp.]|jgi:MGT family glycosyltransferase